jgi:competence CoiA-like predicted nuclease
VTVDKAYIVTQGSHSDYTIAAIFANKEMAEQHIATASKLATHHNFNDVEEWEVNSTLPPHRVSYRVQIDLDGEVVYKTSDVEWSPTDEPVENVQESYLSGARETSFWAISYRGFDVATKAARDKLAQWKAEQAGL